jgi:hypothetical protein
MSPSLNGDEELQEEEEKDELGDERTLKETRNKSRIAI